MESENSSSNESFKSDGENEKPKSQDSNQSIAAAPKEVENETESLNMSHNDLSDVSDLESGQSSDEKNHKVKDLRKKLDEKKSLKQVSESSSNYDTKEKKADEDILDFEAEEGECNDDKEEVNVIKDDLDKKIVLTDAEDEELEEGEISEEDGKRPEENEPKPVCRFYTRGQCTWGMSCRFLHPGVTDKGNYTMFDMVRPVPTPHFNEFRESRPPSYGIPLHHSTFGSSHVRPPITTSTDGANESAWERGLRTAKEMMRKASKRKEQDIDFEDKKMNLSLTQEEMEKDNYYIRDRGPNEQSPSYKAPMYSPGRPMHRPSFEEDSFGRMPRYREVHPPHRPSYYEDQEKRRNRPMREVIVQKADQWSDPWMRSKSPGARKRVGTKRDRRSYSSNSSYSSSSSSNSDSSSESSSSSTKHRRFSRHKSRDSGKVVGPYKKRVKSNSPSPKLQYSPVLRKNIPSPKNYERRVVSPPMDRRYDKGTLTPKRKINSPRKVTANTVSNKKRGRSSSSNSESSESSGSESDSSYSSSSESSDDSSAKHIRSRDKILHERKNATKKVEMSRKRSPLSNSDEKNKPGSKKSNRREELLKQLKAVEDAIARKRSKIN